MAVGYASLTMEGVAARPETSKTVLYRRWPTRPELALAALRHHQSAIDVPDTGTLRGDVLRLLRAVSARNVELIGILSVLQADYYQQTGLSPSALRERTPGGGLEIMELLLQRAVTRGAR